MTTSPSLSPSHPLMSICRRLPGCATIVQNQSPRRTNLAPLVAFPTSTWRVRRLLNLCLLLLLASAAAPLHAAARASAPAQQQPAQQSVPQTLNFVNNVAQVQSTANLNQNQIYLFFGTQGQNLQVHSLRRRAGLICNCAGPTTTSTKASTIRRSTGRLRSRNRRIIASPSTHRRQFSLRWW